MDAAWWPVSLLDQSACAWATSVVTGSVVVTLVVVTA